MGFTQINIMEVSTTNDSFKNIFGYDDVKTELNLIYSWITNPELRKNPNITLPRGICFYGKPGCGKSLFVKEFVEKLNVPTFYIETNEGKSVDEVIDDAFDKALKQEFSVIVIDEIDMLLDNRCVRRTLQTRMDGVSKDNKIFFLATTNYIDDIPDAFLRPGRFDKQIAIPNPDKPSRVQLFKRYLDRLGIKVSDSEINHIANYASAVTCADVMAICNDVYLRCGTNVSGQDVEDSYDRISNRSFTTKPSPFLGDRRIAVHEAGHAIMTLRYSKNFNLYKISYTEGGGVTETFDVDEHSDSIEKREQMIRIGLSGYAAEEIILGKHDIGSVSDIDKVHHLVEKLVYRTCIDSLDDYIGLFRDNNTRYETPAKRARIEKKVNKLTNKYLKEVREFISKHKREVEDLAELIVQKGRVTQKDIEQLGNVKDINCPVGSLIASYARSVMGETA